MRVALITNPRSRQNRRDPGLLTRLSAQLGNSGAMYVCGDNTSLHTALTDIEADWPDVLAINGGDGTVHVILTALMNRFGRVPIIAVLPGGTMNTVAGSYGVRGPPLGPGPETWLARLLAGLPPTVERSLLRVDGGGEPQYGFLFGNGLISNFLEVYYEGSEPTPTKALSILAKGVLSSVVGGAAIRRLMKPVRVRVTADGQLWPAEEYLAVAAGTADDVGFGFRAFFRALTNPGRMHALGIACSVFAFVRQLPRIWLARPLTHPAIRQELPLELVLEADGEQVFMVDGDFHRAGERVTVRALPPIRLAVPR